MQPFKIRPVCKDYLWGGTRLATQYGKKSNTPIIAESWELSAHPDGMCTAADGPLAGQKLAQIIAEKGSGIISDKAGLEGLPVLIKLIDAAKDLSIQVHPDDAFALQNEKDFGKTEMWYILDAAPEATLYFGLKETVTKDRLAQHIADGTVTELLNRVPVKKGDVFFISPGTIHAIGAGILLAEVQQCSNVTYRVFDYNRLGPDGQPRALHIEKTLQVASLSAQPVSAAPAGQPENLPGGSATLLATCPYFTAILLDVQNILAQNASSQSFHSLLVLEGQCRFAGSSYTALLQKGESFFVPAGFGNYTLEGQAKVLLSTL